MEKQSDEPNTSKETTHGTKGLSKQFENLAILQENLTTLDLSSKNIATLKENIRLPPTLIHLNLSHNQIEDVPDSVLNLENLKTLDLSHNKIRCFDSVPNFCHSLEELDISDNHLEGPPYWVWAEKPQRLTKLNLSNNKNITKSFTVDYFEELLTYSTSIIEISLENCALNKYKEFLLTLPKAKSLLLGTTPYRMSQNIFTEVPCKVLNKCCDLERLNMCNTNICTVNSSIEMYKHLVEINLAFNNLTELPKEFCSLENLQICILSVNKILCLPEEMHKMKKLVRLYLDSNDLCLLHDNLHEMSSLKTLDLYDNNLNEIPGGFSHLDEVDFAYNYFEEPDNSEYTIKKEKLRLSHENRHDGRKLIIENSDDREYSGASTEYEEDLNELDNSENQNEDQSNVQCDPPSSPEDWDSDAYWVPSNNNYSAHYSHKTSWLSFVKRKMAEGNFCPMDAHAIPVAEKIRQERMCNQTQADYETDGQFDDYSSDET